MFTNIPKVKLGIVAVSRDCFPESLSVNRRKALVTLLDINNSVPKYMYKESIEGKFPYTHKDTFMGFHCSNTCSSKLASCEMKNQMIMARALPEEVTNGTLEGDIAPGKITFYRLQSTADAQLRAYVAEGEVLPVATRRPQQSPDPTQHAFPRGVFYAGREPLPVPQVSAGMICGGM